MNTKFQGTLSRSVKGPLESPPSLRVSLQAVVDTVAGWPGINKSVHWHFADLSRVDGVDFYFGDEELGHIHLEGEIHIAAGADLTSLLIAEGAAKPFRYQAGWVEEQADRIGTVASIQLFRRNYERLQRENLSVGGG